MNKEYYLGIDMGTNSLGWAVTDTQYKLLRAKGKDLWGVRLFDEAITAEKRRTQRVSRRRRQREKARIGLLKMFFADEIEKVDKHFYLRMEESKYLLRHKSLQSKYSLFIDENYTDVDYYTQYPTIFHLRKELIENEGPYDVRLIFLAILNMFKHRGHFLNESLSSDTNEDMSNFIYEQLLEKVVTELDYKLNTGIDYKKVEEILSKKDISRTKKLEELSDLFEVKKKDKKEYELLSGLCGLSVKLKNFIPDAELTEEWKKFSFCFRDGDYQQKLMEMENILPVAVMEIIEDLKRIHDEGLLASIMKGSEYLSQARVQSYEKHNKDLKLLKDYMKAQARSTYDSLFRQENDGSYSAYVHSVNAKVKSRRGTNSKTRTRDAFYIYLKKILEKLPSSDEKNYFLNEIANETLLPKQMNFENGIIPNQVHLRELKKILDNATLYLPFLKEKDDTHMTVAERILALFSFQLPYYIGPTSTQHKDNGGNAWVIRKSGGQVLPWNLEDKIDVKQTAEEFIIRMVRRCSYLNDEKVLPNGALLYEKYKVLNELNSLKVNGEKISVPLKQAIYTDLFATGKKVTRTQLTNYLVAQGTISIGDVSSISGIDGDFKNTLSSYSKFKAIFGDDICKDSIRTMIEKIIFWTTIYGNDKKFLKECILEHYIGKITEQQMKRILGFKFKEWGRLSKEFLYLEGCDKSTGETLPLIKMLWERNETLQELLSDKYTYIEKLQEQENCIANSLREMTYDNLNDYGLSAPVKRMVWQTVLIVKEVVEVLGTEPKRVFVEVTRGGGTKNKRTDSRKKRLIELYKHCKEESRSWVKELEERSDSELRSKKLYLYYMQKGRCMYSGEMIELSDLFRDNLYDIDHIYPRCFVKDDSIENNLVLVKREANAHKADHYPIEDNIYQDNKVFWKSLLKDGDKDGFITKEKYNRLVNRVPFTDEQLAGFINRQLVETAQGTKIVTKILEDTMKNTEVVYVKAGNVSEFRHQFDYIKCRSINDFHHAKDAYLNIVVGNTYHIKFTKNPMNFIKEYRKEAKQSSYHMSKIFLYDVQRGAEVAWMAAKNGRGLGSREIVENMLQKNTPLITRMSYEVHGGIADQTLYSAKKANKKSYMPLKSSDKRMEDVTLYGGYTSMTTTYFFLVEYEKKGKKIRSIEALPLYMKATVEQDSQGLLVYCTEKLQMQNPRILLSKINTKSLIKRNGYYLNISGKTLDQLAVYNGVPLCLDEEWNSYVRKIEISIEKGILSEMITQERNIVLYKALVHKHLETIYAKRPNPVGKKLNEKLGEFEQIDAMEQVKVLGQVLQLTCLKNLTADLELIGGNKNTGIMKISKVISDCHEFLLINQSPSGLYEKPFDLLKL